jgi:hypothetical protein
MKYLIALLMFTLFPNTSNGQDEKSNFVETSAEITELDLSVSGRRSTLMATVNFTTNEGETITSKVRLLHIPFLGSSKKVGDTITILYDTNNPYVIKNQGDSFLQTYGMYILIALGILFSLYSLLKHKKI